jgi:hypothetical protein
VVIGGGGKNMSRFDDIFDNVSAPQAVQDDQGKALRVEPAEVVRLEDFRRRALVRRLERPEKP